MVNNTNYTELHRRLKEIYSKAFDGNKTGYKGVTLLFRSFTSDSSFIDEKQSNPPFYDSGILKKYNDNFKYPVFVPEGEKARKQVIILLHGLNERDWGKYLTWAYSLAQKTGKSVIMFPISYHMNRAPEQWNNPRQMLPYVQKRKKLFPGIKMLSVANVAISERLTNKPERLFLSGYQAATDLINLIDSINSGKHPLFDKNASVDFFSYSIGTFLTQILMLGNPGKKLDNSKFFFFCGGSSFEDMHGISKYILDTKASEILRYYYLNKFEDDVNKNKTWRELYERFGLGEAFKAMLSFNFLKHTYGGLFSGYKDRLMTTVLKKDNVISPDAVKKVLKGSIVNELDFGYRYIHENPFPVSNTPAISNLVNTAFNMVINKAASFLI
ncbi:MAG: hypothetical protein GXO47_07435 [Chlorobi bacterium]|nr:hypothetical protein [Chlorobiota bacterium]